MKDLSGGQKRRLQLLLILLSEPNVLILDEPTNDLDTDMLAAIEDLLDSFPGTLLVVSHDRYLVERVTDQQYAVIDGGLRHLPRGVDQYLELRAAGDRAESRSSEVSSTALEGHRGLDRLDHRGLDRLDHRGRDHGGATTSGKPKLGGAELRNAQKEHAAASRKIDKLNGQIAGVHEAMALHDQADYTGLGTLAAELAGFQQQLDTVELRWLELEELLG